MPMTLTINNTEKAALVAALLARVDSQREQYNHADTTLLGADVAAAEHNEAVDLLGRLGFVSGDLSRFYLERIEYP